MKKEDLLRIEQEEHRRYHQKLVYVFIVILIVLFGGATTYSRIEGWRYLDALYFSAYTMTTVGYGDITPKTDLGKIFTIFYVFFAVGIALYGLSIIAAHFVEVREEFWIEKIEGIKIRQRTKTFWDKLKDMFSYKQEEVINENKEYSKRK